MNSQFALFRARRFWPLFLVQFLGAFNDNFAKSVFVVLIAYGVWDTGSVSAAVLVSVAAGIFIIPFIVFTPFAGHLADRFDKARMIVWTKIAEGGIVVTAIAALYMHSIELAFVSLFALGVQSAFFTPCKFSILPQHLRDEELVAGNGLVSSGTYIAILGGTMLGALIIPLGFGKEIAAAILVAAALCGYVAALYIPAALPQGRQGRVSFNILAHVWRVWRLAFSQGKGVLAAIVGTAWFYFIAATFHAQFPNFTKMTLGADTMVLSACMAIFSIGIAVGGMLNHVLLKGQVSARFVPWAGLAVGLFGLDLYLVSSGFPKPVDGAFHSFIEFFTLVDGLRVSFDLFALAMAAGVYVIPLRAIVQGRTLGDVRGRVLSSSNMMEAVFILASAALAAAVFSFGASVQALYLMVCALTFVIGIALFILGRGRGKS